MRTARRGVFSSLVTRLTLAVLAVLVLSLGLTTTVFIVQSHTGDQAAIAAALGQRTTKLAVRAQVCRSLLNANPKTPLARVGPLPPGVDRLLLTVWGSGTVAGDTGSGGGPLRLSAPLPVDYRRLGGDMSIGGIEYAYLALPLLPGPSSSSCALNVNASYQYIVMLARVPSLPARAWDVVSHLAVAGGIAILVSLLAALIALRALTRPLHAMTRASENMAAGDYDQRVVGDASADEIGQLARSFNHMAAEVKRAREAQRQFVANVSHDLRSPLTSIIGFSQALTEDAAAPAQSRRAAEIINSEAQRLQRLTLDLLDLSRLEAGRLPLSRRPLDLNALLREVAARYHALPSKRGVYFTDSLCPQELPVLGDPDRLTQVVVNLLDNALKFCQPDGEVRLSSARQDGVAVVEVYNTGAGIAPEDLPRVFDRFYRGDHSRAQQTGGSGIGLAIVRELVHAHGGEVTASSARGAGVAMTVRLPLARDAEFTKGLQTANTGATGMSVYISIDNRFCSGAMIDG